MRLFFIIVASGVLFAVGCDGGTYVKGRVLDPSGKPIAGAIIKLTRQTDDTAKALRDTRSDKTDADGRFHVGMTHEPSKKVPFTFEVSKEGFVTHSEKLVGTANFEKEITLQPEKK